MPRALKICPVPGCPELVESGRCAAHRLEVDRARGSATARGYNTRGHRLFRSAVLERDPICVLCLVERPNTPRLATVADHHPLSRRELLARGLDPDDPDSGRGLCKPHHDRETARQQPGGWAAANLAPPPGG